jgi:hypothetical protein
MTSRRKPKSRATKQEPISTPIIAVSNPSPVVILHAADLEGPEPILICVKRANEMGHKVDRRGRVLMCWHCDHSGMLLTNGERTGTIFAERCPGIQR